MREVQKFSDCRTDDSCIVVHGLTAAQDQVVGLILEEGCQSPCDSEGVGPFKGWIGDLDRIVRAHGDTPSESIDSPVVHGYDGHLSAELFFQLHRLLNGHLVEEACEVLILNVQF